MLTKLNDEGAIALLEAIFSEGTFNDVIKWNPNLNVFEYRDGVSSSESIAHRQRDSRPWNPVKCFGRLREL